MQIFAKHYLNGILMGHKQFGILLKVGLKFQNFTYLEGIYICTHVEFLFSSNFDAICFSELIDPSALCIPYWETTFQIIQVYRFIYSKVTYQYWIKLEIKTSCHNENNDHVTSEYHMYIVNFMLIFFLNSFVVHIFASKLLLYVSN